MLVLTPVPAHPPSYAYRARAPAMYSEVDYFDAVAERAAQEYAAAQARLQAIEQQREQAQRQQYSQEAARRQAALDKYYREQSRLIAAYVRPTSYAPVRRTSSCAIEELSFSVRREEQRQRALLARQREAQRARALAEAKRREEVDRRRRAYVEAQREKEEEAILAFLALTTVISEDSKPTQKARALVQRPSPCEVHRLHECRANDIAEDDLRAAFEGFLSQFSVPSAPAAPSKPADVKGKGKAVDAPKEAPAATAPSPAPQQSEQAPSFKEELEARIRSETDPDVQESLVRLYSDIFDDPRHESAPHVAGPSTSKRESKPASSPSSRAPATPSAPAAAESTPVEAVHLHRTPALPPAVAEKLLKFYHARRARKLSLAQIKDVEDALRKLESTFQFPEHLDFVNPVSNEAASAGSDSDEPGALAYTANNTPVHAYEHALNGLLTQLDAVESNGDLEVRGRRKEVVREVERALEAVERRVEESRERSRERERARRRSASASPVEDVIVTVVPEVKPDSPTESTHSPSVTSEVPEADTVSFALVDTPSPVDSPQPSRVHSPVLSVHKVSVPHESAAGSASIEQAAPAPAEIIEAPEADTVSVELVEAPSAATESAQASPSEDSTQVNSSCSASTTLSETSPAMSSLVEASVQGEGTSETPEIVSPLAPSEPSDTTFATARSTLPSTSVPTPEAITRATSSATDATFQTAEADFSAPSPVDAALEPPSLTRAPSEASSAAVAAETFLLSSTPLADEPKPSRSQQHESKEEDELEIISKEEAADATKSDGGWSDVDAA